MQSHPHKITFRFCRQFVWFFVKYIFLRTPQRILFFLDIIVLYIYYYISFSLVNFSIWLGLFSMDFKHDTNCVSVALHFLSSLDHLHSENKLNYCILPFFAPYVQQGDASTYSNTCFPGVNTTGWMSSSV